MKFRLVLVLSIVCCAEGFAQRRGVYTPNGYEVTPQGDTVAVIDLAPVYVFRRPVDMRRYARLVANVKKVYPIAREANRRLSEVEARMSGLSRKQQQSYISQVEKDLKREYTPVLKKMTFSQGKILIKLIDRETDRTSYALVKELRGSFSAFFWQGIARIFGANLKDTYDKDGDDKLIEQIIVLYEAGLI